LNTDELLDEVAELRNRMDELARQISAIVNVGYSLTVQAELVKHDLQRLHNKLIGALQVDPKVTQQNSESSEPDVKVTQQNRGRARRQKNEEL